MADPTPENWKAKRPCQYFIGDADSVECGRCKFPRTDHWRQARTTVAVDEAFDETVPHDEETTRLLIEDAKREAREIALECQLARTRELHAKWDADADARRARVEGKLEQEQQADAKGALRFRTGKELAETTSGPVPWIVESLIVAGALTELVGKIKVAGKTTFALAIVRAVLDGSPFLGRPTVKGPVVYLTEQPDASFRVAAKKAGVLGREDFLFLSWHDRAAAWEETVEAAVAKAREIRASLLVVDTLSRWAGIKDENDAGAAMEAYAPLKDAAGRDGIAGLLLRHARKGGGDIGEAGRGSSGFSGEADILVDLRRLEGKQTSPNRRQLETLGRFGDPVQVVIELTPEGYRNLGTRDEMDATATAPLLLTVLPDAEDEAQTVAELVDKINSEEPSPKVTDEALRKALARMHEGKIPDTKVGRSGAGKRGNPYRYWRVAR